MSETKEAKAKDNKALEKVNKGEMLDSQQMGEMLAGLSPDKDSELTADYLSIEVGEEVRAWFVGMGKIKKIDGEDGETTEAVTLITEDGRRAINADVVLVSTCRNISLEGKSAIPLLIQCVGKEGAKGREYKKFKVFPLK